jgi:hypothetical protein
MEGLPGASGSLPSAGAALADKSRLRPSTTWLRLLDGALDRSSSLPESGAPSGQLDTLSKRRCATQDSAPAAGSDGQQAHRQADAAERFGSQDMDTDSGAAPLPEAPRYYDIVEPAAALKALEAELDNLVRRSVAAGEAPDSRVTCDAVCLLIKQECDAEVRLRFAYTCALHSCFAMTGRGSTCVRPGATCQHQHRNT